MTRRRRPPIRIFGIRHDDPSVAALLRRALDRLDPGMLAIEAPPEAAALFDARVVAPPAELILWPEHAPERARRVPLSPFAPEWIALDWAKARARPVRLIDLPRALWPPLAPPAAPPEPIAAAEAVGLCADGWWRDWRDAFDRPGADPLAAFDAIARAAEALRAQRPEALGAARLREVWMRRALRRAADQTPAPTRPIAVVCGALHAPALAEPFRRGAAAADARAIRAATAGRRRPAAGWRAAWAPGTLERLAPAAGGAPGGPPAPGWAAADHRARTVDATERERGQGGESGEPGGGEGAPDLAPLWSAALARVARAQGWPVSAAEAVAAAEIAAALAALRGRARAELAEIEPACRAVFTAIPPAALDALLEDFRLGRPANPLVGPPEGGPIDAPAAPREGGRGRAAACRRGEDAADGAAVRLDGPPGAVREGAPGDHAPPGGAREAGSDGGRSAPRAGRPGEASAGPREGVGGATPKRSPAPRSPAPAVPRAAVTARTPSVADGAADAPGRRGRPRPIRLRDLGPVAADLDRTRRRLRLPCPLFGRSARLWLDRRSPRGRARARTLRRLALLGLGGVAPTGETRVGGALERWRIRPDPAQADALRRAARRGPTLEAAASAALIERLAQAETPPDRLACYADAVAADLPDAGDAALDALLEGLDRGLRAPDRAGVWAEAERLSRAAPAVLDRARSAGGLLRAWALGAALEARNDASLEPLLATAPQDDLRTALAACLGPGAARLERPRFRAAWIDAIGRLSASGWRRLASELRAALAEIDPDRRTRWRASLGASPDPAPRLEQRPAQRPAQRPGQRPAPRPAPAQTDPVLAEGDRILARLLGPSAAAPPAAPSRTTARGARRLNGLLAAIETAPARHPPAASDAARRSDGVLAAAPAAAGTIRRENEMGAARPAAPATATEILRRARRCAGLAARVAERLEAAAPAQARGPVDWPRTLRANLGTYAPARRALVPERLIRRPRPDAAPTLTLLLDQSGSMGPAGLDAAALATALAATGRLRLRIGAFDHRLRDLSERAGAPAAAARLAERLGRPEAFGGGTDLPKALAWAASETRDDPAPAGPTLLFSDLRLAGPPEDLLRSLRRLARRAPLILCRPRPGAAPQTEHAAALDALAGAPGIALLRFDPAAPEPLLRALVAMPPQTPDIAQVPHRPHL